MAWHPFRNIGLKVVALLLGTLLWFTVSGHEIERRISVPVTYRNVPASLELTGEQTDRVVVHVRGDDRMVTELTEADVRVTVDLTGREAGGNIVPLRIDQVMTPARIDVLQIEPGAVTVTLERVGEIQVPVTPTVEGEPAAGYVVTRVTSEPAFAIVTGPESRLTGAVVVVTERVSIDGATSTAVRNVGVAVQDAQLRVASPDTVRVTVQVEPVPVPSVDEAEPSDTDGEQ
jgi:hypothetical protein